MKLEARFSLNRLNGIFENENQIGLIANANLPIYNKAEVRSRVEFNTKEVWLLSVNLSQKQLSESIESKEESMNQQVFNDYIFTINRYYNLLELTEREKELNERQFVGINDISKLQSPQEIENWLNLQFEINRLQLKVYSLLIDIAIKAGYYDKLLLESAS